MASKPWAGESWFGGVLVAGGLAITAISFDDGGGGTVRTAAIGLLIISAGVGTMIHARRQVQVTRCVQCTNLLDPSEAWIPCPHCSAPLHGGCSDMHAEVYHPDQLTPHAGPYRTPDEVKDTGKKRRRKSRQT
jgi:hypothetical protein